MSNGIFRSTNVLSYKLCQILNNIVHLPTQGIYLEKLVKSELKNHWDVFLPFRTPYLRITHLYQ